MAGAGTPTPNFPTSLDTAVTFNSTDNRATIILSAWLTKFWAAIVALETVVGVTASAVTTTLVNRMSGVAAGDKAMSLTGTEVATNKTFTSPAISSPAFSGTPTGLTATHVGLGNVNNTSDASKPVSTATQTALNLKADLASPAFTGTPTFAGAFNEAKGADIASATTTSIGAATGNYVNVTGVVTITGLGTVAVGTRRTVNFTGILLLTYNATSLILPTAASITTAAGDVAEFTSLGSGNWVCTSYLRANGQALASSASATYYAKGMASYTSNTTITHGLGTTPTKIIIKAFTISLNGAYRAAVSDGIAIISGGTIQNSASHSICTDTIEGTPSNGMGTSTTTGVVAQYGFQGGGICTLSAVGGTTFTLTLSGGSEGVNSHNVIWEAFA